MAASIKIGDTVPDGTFTHVPYGPELDSHEACGVPISFNISEAWKGKKVVLFGVPGAFTPTCHVNHLPPYIQRYEEFKQKGVDVIAVVAANDPFVMSGWGRFEGLKDKIITLSDLNVAWTSKLGLSIDLTDKGFGLRTKRFAIIIDDLVVKYIGVEPQPASVTDSGADVVLSKL